MKTEFDIIRWFDRHHHLRHRAMLELVTPFLAKSSVGGVIMPNLGKPITTAALAKSYKQKIMKLVPKEMSFDPLMTCYLTDDITPDEIEEGFTFPQQWVAAKLYFKGHTTNSHNGVSDWEKLYPVFEKMQDLGMPLLVHGEIPDEHHDIFDLEKICVDNFYEIIRKDFPDLIIVAEHITTRELGMWVRESVNTFGTVTPQHLVFNRTDLLSGGLKPDLYCLPILKRDHHRISLRKIITSGNSSFGAGTDSAPHESSQKYSSCGCAGCWNIIPAPSLYAQVFEEEGVFDRSDGIKVFENFMSKNLMSEVYKQKITSETMRFEKKPFQIPKIIKGVSKIVVPLMAGETLDWSYTLR